MEAFQVLGVTPTSDVVAIKRAYAVALKRCRPDDDPQGYQRLREALEWALEWARSAASRPAAGPTAMPESASKAERIEDADSGDDAVRSACAEPEASQQLESEVESTRSMESADQNQQDWVDPGELARSLHQFWREQGDAALVQAWPRLHYELDRIPFSLRGETSKWFASLVLECPDLPLSMVGMLADYFQWGADYRSDAMLGDRAGAMGERLRSSGLRQAADPTVRARFAELLHLKTLIDADQQFKAAVYAAFASAKNEQRLAEAPAHLLQRLRLDHFDQSRLKAKLNLGFLGQLLQLCLLFGVLVFFVEDRDLAFALLSVLSLGAGAVLVVALGMMLGVCLDVIEAGLPEKWRQAGSRPERATLSLVAAALAGLLPLSLKTNTLSTLGIASACSLIALQLAWSPAYSWRGVLLPTAAALLIAVHSLLGPSLSHPLSASVAIGLFWTLAAHWAFVLVPNQVLSLYRSPLKSVLPTSAGDWIFAVLFIKLIAAIFAAVVFLCLPLTYLVQALGLGARYAILTLSLAMGSGLLFVETGQPWFFCLLAAPLVTAGVRWLSGRVARTGWFQLRERI